MNYLRLPHMDSEVSVFDICQAHQQLESDYNVGGWLRGRPSNQRRNESTSCQLWRMEFKPGCRWVEICSDDNEDEDGPVRDIYLHNVLKYGLPIDAEMRNFMSQRYVASYLDQFQNFKEAACTSN